MNKNGILVLDAIGSNEADVIIASTLGGYVMGMDNGIFYVSNKSLGKGGQKIFEHNQAQSYC